MYHWELEEAPRLTDVSPVSTSAITALEWMLGGNSWVAAAEDGSLSGWLRAPTGESTRRHGAAHVFEPQSAPIVGIGFQGGERSFATAGRDGDNRAAAP